MISGAPFDVLVVDSDATARSQIQAALCERGHRVVTCDGATGALEELARHRFPLVIVDPSLPDMPGARLCRRIRSSEGAPATRILLCHRSSRPDELVELLDAGADDYLAKPIRRESLQARLVLLERQIWRGIATEVGLAAATVVDEAACVPGAEPGASQGQLVAGRYELLSLIGSGGTAEVYRARDLRVKQPVALKLFTPGASGDAIWRARVQSEIQLGRAVKHPNVCTIYDMGKLGDRLYLTMELVEGTPLSEVAQAGGPMKELDAIVMLLPAVEGIAAAHRLGIVHRDVKPANLMRTPEGRTVVLDFGLARRLDDARVTRRGQVTGTPAYMAPEQIRDGAVTPAADVWALGCVLHVLIAGRLPLPSSTAMGSVARTLYEEPEPLTVTCPGASAQVETIVGRCLQKDPAARYLDAGALASALRELRDAAERLPRRRRRVLLAEPDPCVARGIEEALVSRGFQVRRFTDGYRLVEDALGEEAEAVIAGANLPVLGGIQALQILRSYPRTASIPAALISRSEEDRVATDMMGLKARFLHVPLDVVRLGSCLQEMGLGI